jgi:putative spermidine/putrescine transport system permease protein/spermidine/putrescine transport system permease protein
MSAAVAASADFTHKAARREARLISFAIWLTLIVGFGLTALIYAPVAWLGILSISGDPLSGLPGAFTLHWYASLFTDTRWLDPLIVSIEIAAGVSVLCMISATLVGRALPRMKRGQGILLTVFLLPLVVPGIVVGIDVFIFYRMFFGIKMGVWSIVLVHFLWAFPFALIGMLVVSSRFDARLLEAAADLGASPWRRFWDIERPLLGSGIATAGMFGFLLSLTELPRSIFVAARTQTLPLFTWAETMSRGSHVSLIYCLNSLIAVVSVALSVLSVWLLGRRLKS